MATASQSAPAGPTGRGWGICVGAVAGLVWLYFALKFDHAPDWALIAVYAMSASLLLAGIMRIRSDRKSGLPQSSATRFAFLIVVAIEVVAIVAAVNLLPRWHLQQYMLAAVAIIVGLHYIPLATIFRTRIYYPISLMMVAATVAAAALLEGTQQMICIGYSMGATFFLSALIRAALR